MGNVTVANRSYMRPAEQGTPNPGDLMVMKLNQGGTALVNLFHEYAGTKEATGTWMRCNSARTGPGEAMVKLTYTYNENDFDKTLVRSGPGSPDQLWVTCTVYMKVNTIMCSFETQLDGDALENPF